jgi:putative holliday junction resolvase
MRTGVRLGVDVGSVRVGLAASDPSGVIATPVQTLPRDLGGRADQHAIAAAVRERAVLEVVVGLPRSLSGLEGRAAALARDYAVELAALVDPVPVRLVDERLSTVDASRTLRDSGVAGRKQRAVVDQAAAVLILQAALDGERSTGTPPGEKVQRGDSVRLGEDVQPGADVQLGADGGPRRPRKPRHRTRGQDR